MKTNPADIFPVANSVYVEFLRVVVRVLSTPARTKNPQIAHGLILLQLQLRFARGKQATARGDNNTNKSSEARHAHTSTTVEKSKRNSSNHPLKNTQLEQPSRDDARNRTLARLEPYRRDVH